ncbi:hypothetical protein NMY22_g19974 [Coprinellus aureogranulatus]|nr:hypothetical protein NMY22_g19974 [Coprinellus aureogranulatus]
MARDFNCHSSERHPAVQHHRTTPILLVDTTARLGLEYTSPSNPGPTFVSRADPNIRSVINLMLLPPGDVIASALERATNLFFFFFEIKFYIPRHGGSPVALSTTCSLSTQTQQNTLKQNKGITQPHCEIEVSPALARQTQVREGEGQRASPARKRRRRNLGTIDLTAEDDEEVEIVAVTGSSFINLT